MHSAPLTEIVDREPKHLINLKHLFRNSYILSDKFSKGKSISWRKEIAILINPCSQKRSPHIEMAVYFYKFAKSINIPCNIYISNLPSLGNIKRWSNDYSLKTWNIDKLNAQLTDLISGFCENPPKIINLHKQFNLATKLSEIVIESIHTLSIKNTYPFHCICFSGGRGEFRGGWGLEWLDPICSYSKYISLAAMGWKDRPIYHEFYNRYIGPENHPLTKFSFITEKYRSFSIINPQQNCSSPVPEDENEKNYPM